MPDRTVLSSSNAQHSVSDGRVIFQAVLSLSAYSAVCGAAAVGLGSLAAALLGPALPASAARLGMIALVVLAAGMNGERVVRHVENSLGLFPTGGRCSNGVK